MIDHLLNGKLLPDVVSQIVDRVAARFELALKFFLGVRALEFGELVLDFAVGGLQAQRFGLLQQDVIVDQLIQNIQLERQRFVLGRLGGIGIQLRAVVLVHLGARDVRAVHHSPHAFVRLRPASCSRTQPPGPRPATNHPRPRILNVSPFAGCGLHNSPIRCSDAEMQPVRLLS